jgi:hypothetical protein
MTRRRREFLSGRATASVPRSGAAQALENPGDGRSDQFGGHGDGRQDHRDHQGVFRRDDDARHCPSFGHDHALVSGVFLIHNSPLACCTSSHPLSTDCDAVPKRALPFCCRRRRVRSCPDVLSLRSDRVMVLDKGRVKEYGRPLDLIENEESGRV